MKKVYLNTGTAAIPTYLKIWVWVQITAHIICGVCTLSFLFPFLDRKNKDQKIQYWSKKLLKILNVELIVQNPHVRSDAPCLIASNHISWLDIHVINAFSPIRFVAKSEAEGWPVFGWMARQLGTVFIRRDSPRHAREVARLMAEVLKTESICIFPEGTSTTGETILPFKPNLFESAIVSQVLVHPLTIRYLSKTTRDRSDAPAFIGDMGLLESMSNIINNRALVAEITILSPCADNLNPAIDRKQLALYCQESISKTL